MTALMNVLVVEDNDVDVERITRCLHKAELPNPIHVALDGEDALDQLRGANGQKAIDTPCLVVLDLQMPRMNGLEFLEELRKEPDLADTPVLVLTTSDRQEDIEQSLRLGAVDYMTKPISQEQLAKLVVSFDAQQHGSVIDERTYTVAVIDSDQAVRDRTLISAMGTGWAVSTFSSAVDSFEHIKMRAPDVIIADTQVGAVSGVALLEQIAALPGAQNSRLFLASDSSIPVQEAQRANALGASIVGKDMLANSEDFREFLEERTSV